MQRGAQCPVFSCEGPQRNPLGHKNVEESIGQCSFGAFNTKHISSDRSGISKKLSATSVVGKTGNKPGRGSDDSVNRKTVTTVAAGDSDSGARMLGLEMSGLATMYPWATHPACLPLYSTA